MSGRIAVRWSGDYTQTGIENGTAVPRMMFKHLRRWLAGTKGMRSADGANLALDILAENGVSEFAIARPNGRLLHLFTRDKVIASSVVRHGTWGAETVSKFAELLRARGQDPAGLTFVNVGANIGTACLNAYDCGFRRMVAFEPEPGNFRLLGRNLRDLAGADVRLVQVAIGDQVGEAALHRHVFNMGAHSLVAGRAERTRDTIAVKVEPLTLHLEAGLPFVLFVDVEGFEPQVLQGAAAALERDGRAIALEVTPRRYAPEAAADLVARLTAFSTECFLLPSGKRLASSDLLGLMDNGRGRQFDLAMVRGNRA